eukprot:TRINITY_DN1332_c0_g1_i2.p1 TRINITY_DN1332_c0_g1~~TRINITY_DN1332_c0_g1_i2.p1  ORF type:complete len:344 (-),score=78.68 TRINITY_DN1332_c0_g1_i2:24-1055(-)
MCSGILIVGFITMAITHEVYFDWRAILGGGAWAFGNTLSMPVISLIGIGLGILTWSSANLVFGYIWGRIGAFGLPKEEVANEYFSIAGVLLAVVALILFFFIKPTLNDDKKDDDEEYAQFNQKHGLIQADEPGDDRFRIDEYPSTAELPWLTNTSFFHSIHKLTENMLFSRLLGIGMALLSGLFYSVSLVPFQLWNSDLKAKDPNGHPNTLVYCFSQFAGIYIVSTGIFTFYCLVVRPPRMNVAATLPSYLAGVLWAIAAAGWMLSTGKLGFTVGYPISAVGPLIVTSLWSVLWFREIRGARNLGLLAIAFVFIGVSILFLVLSNPPEHHHDSSHSHSSHHTE